MAANFPTQDEGVIVGHSRCTECGHESIVTMRNPERFGDDTPYQPLLIPHDDVCGSCIEKAWDLHLASLDLDPEETP